MIQQGFQLSYTKLNDVPYAQAEITTNAVRQVANMGQFDFIMPLDADEFICTEGNYSFKDLLRQNVPLNGLGLMPWATFCPIRGNYFEAYAPLFENFRQRKTEQEQHYKIVLGSEFARHCSIIMGNHDATNRDNGFDTRVMLPISLIHVPVRSAEQIIRKAILGSYALALNPDRKPGQGAHWDLLAGRIRASNFELSDQQLLDAAANYGVFKFHGESVELLGDGPRVGKPDDTIQLRSLSGINLLGSFDAQIAQLVTRVEALSGTK
jgi:hypothetical protein